MGAPVDGSVQQFYCDCLDKKHTETYRDSSYLSTERVVRDHGSATTSWVCKSRFVKSFTKSTGWFSSEEHNIWAYYWECLNCGKIRQIGMWNCCGGSYGDGAHLS
jgi:hypothetical protein